MNVIPTAGVLRKVKHAQTVEVREVEAVSRQEERVDMDEWVRRLTYTQVCEWLASVGVNEMSIQKVREDRVPGSQLLTMTGTYVSQLSSHHLVLAILSLVVWDALVDARTKWDGFGFLIASLLIISPPISSFLSRGGIDG